MVPILAHERLEVSGETFHSRFVPCQDDRTDGAGTRSFGDEPTRGSVSPAFNFEFPTTNDAKSSKLPGEHSPAKVAFEAELEALISRVHHLEIPGYIIARVTEDHARMKKAMLKKGFLPESDDEESEEENVFAVE
ncbi:unnamed protein product [Penicillium camemberti]|uniref:Str. FM013 n=1 Tax=Penicillium camemberti (strain FM 013) TaxID=1429867 RepID=A0A0G4P5M1_PENC3|nr:unnamed protein product [Penicillium camemberti]